MRTTLFLLLFFLFCLDNILADDPHSFAFRDTISVVANTVRPYSNPTETYQYYKLPFCKPQAKEWDEHDLGELLTGSRKVLTDYKLYFGVDSSYGVLCSVKLTENNMRVLKDAIDEEYVFEMYVDDIRVTGEIGKAVQVGVTNTNHYLNTHLHFDIAYNGEISHKANKHFTAQIVGANVSTTGVPTEGDVLGESYYLLSKTNIAQKDVIFSYSTSWHHRPELTWDDRIVKSPLLPDDFEIHWLSIINSFVLVMLLVAFLSIILIRILKRDFSKYMDIEEESDFSIEDEAGWKLVHADVFRFPKHAIWFTALVGAGAQIGGMIAGVLVLSLLGVFHPTKRGGVITAIIVLYALTAGIGGYVSAKLYRQLGGQKWVWNIVLCAFVVPGPFLAIFSFLNTVAIWNDSSAALPFGTIMIILALFLLVAFPLSVIGGIAARNTSQDFEAPCRTNKIPREIPETPLYRHPITQFLTAGCLPFSAVYIELHHIFAAVWGHQIYTLFGILFLSFVMLVFVTSFITITLTYFQLAMEDHQWWWRSFFCGGSTGLFIFAYSWWYYHNSTEMTGFFQMVFFFGYMGMISFCFFICLGSVGFISALFFVKKIYRTIKVE